MKVSPKTEKSLLHATKADRCQINPIQIKNMYILQFFYQCKDVFFTVEVLPK